MTLEKPIVFLDIETTGLNQIKDRIVELYMAKHNPDGSVDEFYSRFNPYPIEVSVEAAKVHGMTSEDLCDEPTFNNKSKEVMEFIKGSDLGGYNILSFDIPILFEEFVRAGIMFNFKEYRIFDSYRMWTHYEPRTLTGATRRFLNRELKDAHRAKADVQATAEIFFKQVDEWAITDLTEMAKSTTELDKKIDLAGKFAKNDAGEIVITFGKHANKSVQKIFAEDSEYFRWMYEKAEMPSDTKMIARKIYTKLTESTK